jgi:hypothetical protein
LDELDRKGRSVPWRVQEAYAAELELERERWTEIDGIVRVFSADERLAPGYYLEPAWSVKDLIAHLGAWMAEARIALLDIAAHSYVPHEVDIEGRNEETLAATRADSWEDVWVRTMGARAWMLEAWFELRGPDEAANQWLRKAGAEHYGEHLARLREWVREVIDLRDRPIVDEWEG